ncbi:MAG: N-formylglutamate amidohydrolase [Candidatus Woesearchaeota archaeon]
MQLLNVLTGEKTEINTENLIISEKRTFDYILSIPHGGVYILISCADRLKLGWDLLIGSDLFTEQVYDTRKGIIISTRLNTYLLNTGRGKEVDETLPLHLRNNFLETPSLTGEKIKIKDYDREQKQILLGYYDQYHQYLKQAILEMKKEFGFVLVFDCHSMNSIGLNNVPDPGKERADFVVGKLDDLSADQEVIAVFYGVLKAEAEKFGLTVRKNDPYKGGFITKTYSDPKNDVHVIQLEIKKSIYMEENLDKNSEFKIKKNELNRINQLLAMVFKITSEKAKLLLAK